MERSWYTRRIVVVNTPFHQQFGITEQSLLRVDHGVGFGDSVPQTGLRATSIVQPRAQCLHALRHSPNPESTTVADDLNNICRFVLREWSSNNGKTFSLSISCPNVQSHWPCLPECVSSGSLYLKSRTNHPPITDDEAPDPRV